MNDQPPALGASTPTEAASAAGPLALYRARRLRGVLQADQAQLLAAEKLQSLHNALRHFRPASGRIGWRARLGLTRREADPPQGLYMFGSVGRGKSMLMDLFFAGAPVALKRRVHFHAFMIEVQERLHAMRRATKETGDDPIHRLASDLAAGAWLFCLDELHVTDIADAMILGRLFEGLFDAGVIIVATSNFAPDELYRDGLQRERFVPFIELIKNRLDIIELEGARDWRLALLEDMTLYQVLPAAEAGAALDRLFDRLTDSAPPRPLSLEVRGRGVRVPKAAKGVARMGFAELCETPLGAEDYLAIATHFHTIILDGVPVFGPDQRDCARRFMTLIDALYEHRTNLIVAAGGPPEALLTEGTLAFEFRRTASRLREMASREYLNRPHLA